MPASQRVTDSRREATGRSGEWQAAVSIGDLKRREQENRSISNSSTKKNWNITAGFTQPLPLWRRRHGDQKTQTVFSIGVKKQENNSRIPKQQRHIILWEATQNSTSQTAWEPNSNKDQKKEDIRWFNQLKKYKQIKMNGRKNGRVLTSDFKRRKDSAQLLSSGRSMRRRGALTAKTGSPLDLIHYTIVYVYVYNNQTTLLNNIQPRHLQKQWGKFGNHRRGSTVSVLSFGILPNHHLFTLVYYIIIPKRKLLFSEIDS